MVGIAWSPLRESSAPKYRVFTGMRLQGTFGILACLVALANAQPFLPGQGVGPLGGWRTTDAGGPYNVSLLSVQANEVAAGGAARMSFTDKDIIDFLTKCVLCISASDTYLACMYCHQLPRLNSMFSLEVSCNYDRQDNA